MSILGCCAGEWRFWVSAMIVSVERREKWIKKTVWENVNEKKSRQSKELVFRGTCDVICTSRRLVITVDESSMRLRSVYSVIGTFERHCSTAEWTRLDQHTRGSFIHFLSMLACFRRGRWCWQKKTAAVPVFPSSSLLSAFVVFGLFSLLV